MAAKTSKTQHAEILLGHLADAGRVEAGDRDVLAMIMRLPVAEIRRRMAMHEAGEQSHA